MNYPKLKLTNNMKVTSCKSLRLTISKTFSHSLIVGSKLTIETLKQSSVKYVQS